MWITLALCRTWLHAVEHVKHVDDEEGDDGTEERAELCDDPTPQQRVTTTQLA